MTINILGNFKDTIGYLLFKKIFFGYILFVLIFTGFQIYKEYAFANKLVLKDMSNIEKSFSDILSKTVWHFDEGKIYSQVKAIVESKIITGIIILTPLNEVIARKGTITNDYKKYDEFIFDNKSNNEITYHNKLTNHRFDLIDVSNNEKEVLGVVTLFVQNNEITEMAEEGVALIIANVIFSAFFLWALFIYFANKLLTAPLNKLITATKDLSVKEFTALEIDLNTEKKHELNTLADTFNEMSRRINESYINLKQLTILQEKQKKDLTDANKYKTDFLANMSHELKTPLNSINVISSIMMKNRDSSLSEKQVKNLQIINGCGNDLLYLINDVLDISKLEAGEVVINKTQINVKSLMTEIKDMFLPQVKEKGIDFVFECDEIEDIYSDENRIKQIIKNLLSNALKFVKQGSIKFIIRNKDENILIEVIDDGIGIEKDKMDHIFDRFKQADGSTTRKYGGTGLGLSICKELLHLLNGDISVESEVNAGTTFRVVLPKDKTSIKNTVKVVKEKVDETPKVREISSLNKENILVLNSDPISFMGIIIELKNYYEVSQVANFTNLLKEFDENKHELIILDSSDIKIDDLNRFLDLTKKKIIIIYKEYIEENIKNKACFTMQKPIDKNLFIKKVLDLRK